MWTARQPEEIDKMRFDYAWKWFNFHAEQRTRMFNYMLIGMGIFATALVTAIDKKLLLEAVAVGFAATVVAVVFYLIDCRNRHLYLVAMDVLIHLERSVMFGEGAKFLDHRGRERDYGISGRVALEDDRIRTGPRPYFNVPHAGQHRHWIPFIALGFGALFCAAAVRELFLYTGAVPRQWVIAIGAALCVGGLFVLGQRFRRHKPEPESEAEPELKLLRPEPAPDLPFLSPICLALGLVLLGLGLFHSALRAPLERHLQLDTSVVASLDDATQAKLAFGAMDRVGVIGSATFQGSGPGLADLDCRTAENQAASRQIQQWLQEIGQRNERPLLILVGSTANAPLPAGAKGRYATTNDLAKTRTDSAQACLAPGGALSASADVMPLVGGPLFSSSPSNAASAASAPMKAAGVVRVSVIAFR